MNDDGSHDELYGIDQVDWNIEQTRFKDIMREVVYRTTGIYYDGVKDTEDSQSVVCQRWSSGKNNSETMGWYAMDKVSLRQIDRDRLVAMALEDCERWRDENYSWDHIPTQEEAEAERAHRLAHPDGEGWRTDKKFDDPFNPDRTNKISGEPPT